MLSKIVKFVIWNMVLNEAKVLVYISLRNLFNQLSKMVRELSFPYYTNTFINFFDI